MVTVALQTRASHRPRAVVAAVLTAMLIILATVALAIARNGAGARASDPAPVAGQVSTLTSACVWRHHGWFC
jgi:hypothetical protein